MGHGFFPLILASLMSQVASTDRLVVVPDASVIKLDDLGLYRVGLVYRGQPEHEFPTGWSGPFDEATGVACQPVGVQNGKRCFCCTVLVQRHGARIPGVSDSAPPAHVVCCCVERPPCVKMASASRTV